MILGIDEVGRGPWAGPLVVGAVVLGDAVIDGLTDSKKLTKKRREALDPEIRDQVAGFGLGWVHADELDQIGLSASLVLATKRAVEQITVPYSEIIIDGTINFLKDTTKGQYVTTLPKADLLIPSVSAASIIAKVARDQYMADQDDTYPGYRFGSHSGYGTAAHRAAIERLGVTPLHRLSFAPLQKYRPVASRSPLHLLPSRNGFAPGSNRGHNVLSASGCRYPVKTVAERLDTSEEQANQTTKQIGDAGETAAANYLVRLGHEIIDRNWRTKYCEIDIISLHNGTLYFTEVKYRKNADQGGGLAAVTRKKQNQMDFAARLYVQSNKITDTDLRLAVVDVTGAPPEVREYLKLN